MSKQATRPSSTPASNRSSPAFRRLAGRFGLLVLLLGSLAGFAWFDNEAYRGITYTPQLPPIAWADVPQLGVNAYNIQFEPDRANVTRTLELARDLGARYVRMQMPWEDIEIHGKGDFEDRRNQQAVQSAWDKYDFILNEMQRLGLEPIVRIDRPPQWARATAHATPKFQEGLKENGNSTGPPDTYADYADFVAIVAERYRGKVRFIQLWNEPNLAYEWNWVLPEPERFVELLGQAATAARAANPEVVILFPSLSPTDGLEPRIAPLSELEYLDRVYKAGGAAFFDIMSAQAYGLGQPPDEHRYIRLRTPSDWVWSRPIDTRIDVSRLVLLREVMVQNGDQRKAIWVSEFGYVSAPPELAHEWGEPVTEEQKAAYMVGQLERARREWPWLGVMNAWFLRWGGEPPDPANPTAYFALVQHDFTPLPAYHALREYAAQPAVAGPGAHAWSHPAVIQRGPEEWEVRFTGQSLELFLSSPSRISVDGGQAFERNPDVHGGPISVASSLADSEHTVVVQSALPPDMFMVGRSAPNAWLAVLVPALLIVGLAVVCGRLFYGWGKR